MRTTRRRQWPRHSFNICKLNRQGFSSHKAGDEYIGSDLGSPRVRPVSRGGGHCGQRLKALELALACARDARSHRSVVNTHNSASLRVFGPEGQSGSSNRSNAFSTPKWVTSNANNAGCRCILLRHNTTAGRPEPRHALRRPGAHRPLCSHGA